MSDEAIDCPRCEVTYRPARTDLACPVCRTPAAGTPDQTERNGLDHRALVIAVSAVDFLALALVALWLFG